MWHLIFTETIPVPNWTGGCLGSFITVLIFITWAICLELRKDKKKKKKEKEFEEALEAFADLPASRHDDQNPVGEQP